MPSPKGAKHLFPRNKGQKNSFAGTQEDKKLGLLQLLQQPLFCPPFRPKTPIDFKKGPML